MAAAGGAAALAEPEAEQEEAGRRKARRRLAGASPGVGVPRCGRPAGRGSCSRGRRNPAANDHQWQPRPGGSSSNSRRHRESPFRSPVLPVASGKGGRRQAGTPHLPPPFSPESRPSELPGVTGVGCE